MDGRSTTQHETYLHTYTRSFLPDSLLIFPLYINVGSAPTSSVVTHKRAIIAPVRCPFPAHLELKGVVYNPMRMWSCAVA